MGELGHDVSGGVEVVAEHHVRGDEELVDGCVVGGTEAAADKACAASNWIAAAVIGKCLRGGCAMPLEGVGLIEDAAGIIVGAVGEIVDCRQDGLDGRDPLELGEEIEVVGGSVVICRYLEKGGK